jgi:hypothetical protein
VEVGADLQRTQVAPEGDAFTFVTIASHGGMTVDDASLATSGAEDVLAALR